MKASMNTDTQWHAEKLKCVQTHFRICANQLSAGLRRYLSSSKSIWVTEVWPDSRVSYTFLGEEAKREGGGNHNPHTLHISVSNKALAHAHILNYLELTRTASALVYYDYMAD